MFTPHRAAELISLGMTLPTMVLSAAVVYFWWPSLKKHPKTGSEWFVIGVVFGFIGAFLDNTYWFIPWTASFLDLESKGELVDLGVYFNIFFRQGLGTFAAYCHLKAAELTNDKDFKILNSLLLGSTLLGVLYAIGITLFQLI